MPCLSPFFTAHLSPHHPDVALRETSNNSQSDMPPLPRQIDSLDLFGNPSVKLKPDSNSDGLTDNPATQRKDEEGQDEEVIEKPERFTMQEMARGLSLFV